MSVFSSQFDSSLSQCSPVQKDFERVVNYDENGNEFITWKEVDYPSFQASNGLVSDWSLDSLIKAGIDPGFPIHTGNPTRLDGIGVLNEAASIADEILSDSPKND